MMDELRAEVQEFQERWNSMVLDITEDFRITCEEARRVRQWLAVEKKAYYVLKRKINLGIRSSRHDHDKGSEGAKAAERREAKIELGKVVHEKKALLLAMDELLLKADEMNLRMERLLAQCEEAEQG